MREAGMKRTTLAAIALVLVPSFAAAQQTTDTTRADSTQRADSARQQPATPQDTTGAPTQAPTQVQTPTTEQPPVDSANVQQQDTAASAARAGTASACSGRNLGLTRSQVRQLQEALNSSGCDAG